MKISESKLKVDTYLCDWCGTKINQNVHKPSHLVCPDCGRFVSQKTKFELEEKK